MEIEAKEARKKLSLLWVIGSLILLGIFIFQQLLGKFEDKSSEAWMWIAPNIFPMLGLIMGSYIYNIRDNTQMTLARYYYRLSIAISTFYLFTILAVILSYPVSNMAVLDHYRSTNIFLVPLQTIIISFLGVFFIKSNRNEGN